MLHLLPGEEGGSALLERDIRIFATGRKSWLLNDTVDGAKASAVIYSLMLTCRACGVEPLAWLKQVLTDLPQRSDAANIEDLLRGGSGNLHSSDKWNFCLSLA